jgi:Zn-dependent membrane protease YugP
MDFIVKWTSIAAATILLGFVGYAAAQDKPADNMQILREKIMPTRNCSSRPTWT